MALRAPTRDLASYPSWQPQRAIDHILVSESLRTGEPEVFDMPFSDHLPVGLEIDLPAGLDLPAARPVITVETSGWV